MRSTEAQELWNWIHDMIMDPEKKNWCTPPNNAGPTYRAGASVDEPIAMEVVNGCFGGFGQGHAIEFFFGGEACILYAVKPQQKPDKTRGWMMNFHLRHTASRNVLRANLHVHLRMLERMKALPDDEGFTTVKNTRKRVNRKF